MKRTFSTLSCMELDVWQIAALAARNGMDCVEIRLDKKHCIAGLGLEQADTVRRAMAQNGVSILDLGLSASFTQDDAEALALAKRGVDLAAAVQAKAVRIFAGGHQARFSDTPDEDFDGIVRILRVLCDYAAAKGVEVWAETHSSYSTGAAIRQLIDAVGHPSLYALWDVIHSIEFGEKPADSVRILGDRIAHVHLKDGTKIDADSTQHHHTDLGLGELPLGAVLSELQSAGYEGALSLEWEAPWRPELHGLHTDPDELLAVYNAWLDRFAQNLLPPVPDAAWETYTPPGRAFACFERGGFDDCLSIALQGERFAVGKWITRVPVAANTDYTFSVLAKTELSIHNVYVLVTLIDANGDMQIREHPLQGKRCGPFWQFTDHYRTPENTAQIEVELWCKGTGGQVSWFSPLLYPSAPLPERKVKVAIGYIDHRGETLQTLASNEQLILQTLDACGQQGADLAVLGEGSRGRYTAASLEEKALPDDAPFCEAVRQKAREYGMYVVFNFHERENGDIYNTSMLIGRDGGTVGKYRKTHLTVGELESGIVPGVGYPVFDTDFGKIGMLICYDQYFSETVTPLVEAGAELICISTAGDAAEKGVARAMDGGVYLAVCGWNQENGHNWKPGRVIAPDGSFLAETDTDFEPAVCEIDLNQKIRRFWLSVGPANAEIRGVYRYEKNPDSFLG